MHDRLLVYKVNPVIIAIVFFTRTDIRSGEFTEMHVYLGDLAEAHVHFGVQLIFNGVYLFDVDNIKS